MQLVDAFVRSPVKVTVGVLLVALFGFVALMQMPMQLTPEVETPTITIETRWTGASPQEVEREIVIEQEEQLSGLEGLTKMSSDSANGQATVTLEFLVGSDMQKAIVDVTRRLEQVREYPETADKPVISTSNASDRPIAYFILSGQRPSEERLVAFVDEHPELAEGIDGVRRAHNPGLAMMRLRRLAEAHPEAKVLLPPPDLDVTKLRRFAEDTIEQRMERVSGVSQANVLGGLEDEMQVVVDPQRLAARGLTIDDVRNVLLGQNGDISGGDFWESKRRWAVRTLGQFRQPEQVADQLLFIENGAPVYIRDVAEVRHGYKKPDGLVRRFGESSIAISATRTTGANVLEVMEGLRQAVIELNRDTLSAKGLILTQVYDETDYIYSSLDLVQDNIFVGGSLTFIVLMCFLHLGVRAIIMIPLIALAAVSATFLSPWFFAVSLALMIGAGFWFARGALVVGLAIPISIIGTFLVLGMLGRSLNVISLAGLAFAVGMLVDNAVVVLENIYRRYAEFGEDAFTAATRGTQEVWGAVIASTLTTVAVFLPIVFVEQEAGQLFRDIALAISAAVALSLVVSVTVIPTAAARLLPKRRKGEAKRSAATHSNGHATTHANGRPKPEPKPERRGWAHAANRVVVGPIEWLGGRFIDLVVGINSGVQQSIFLRIGVVVLLTSLAAWGSYAFWPKVEYLPTGNRNLILGFLIPPPGYNLDEIMAMGEFVESKLEPYFDVEPDSPEAAKLDYPVVGDFFFIARGKMVFLGVRAHDPMRVRELQPLVRQIGQELPGTIAAASQSSLFERGLSGGRKIEVEVSGPDLPKLVGLGGQIMGKAKALFPDAGLRPVPSLDLSSPELHVQPKLVQAAEMGVRTQTLGYTVDALVDGAYAGDYFFDGEKIDLTIIGEKEYVQRTQDLRTMPVTTPSGQLVPLEAVATITLASGPEQINRREKQRAITIEVTPAETMPLETAMDMIRSEIVAPLAASGQLDGGYRINLGGTADKLRNTWEALSVNVLLAVLITYLLMAALFESWLYPFVVILSVPLGAVGGVLGLWVLNLFVFQSLDVLTMLGFVILIGTVVNNPILIVEQALNHIRHDGMTPRDAILESVRTRIRPIFMTTVTTVLGLLPLVVFPGAGSELYRGLGAVVLGGLIVSTIFTLILVPTLFSLMMESKVAVLRLLGMESREMDAIDQDESQETRPREEPVGV
jgi:HAE1 family hydrophobic/amphiphilic exporter-1